MSIAICVNCGNIKKDPVEVCTRCNFRPDSTEQKVKSIILSTHDIADVYSGKTKDELLALAPLVASGTYKFDEGQVQMLVAEMQAALTTPKGVLIWEFFQAIGIPVLLVLALLAILWLTR